MLAALLVGCVPALSGLEQTLVERGAMEHPLGEVLLMASGVSDEASLAREQAALDALLLRVDKKVRSKNHEDEQLAVDVLQVLHSTALKRYVADTSDLRVTVHQGIYNCLTATSLYVLAARRAGLIASAYAMSGHVMATVFLPDGPRFIETTDPTSLPARDFESTAVLALRLDEGSVLQAERDAKKLVRKAAAAQEQGLDAPAEALLDAAGQALERPWLEAEAAERELMASAFDVDVVTLASLYYWNRALSAALDVTMFAGNWERSIKRSVDLFGAFLALGRRAHSLKRSLFAGVTIEQLAASVALTRGFEVATNTLAAFLATPLDADETTALRDVRARVWISWFRHGGAKQRCTVLRLAEANDPEHPVTPFLRANAPDCP